MSDEDLVDRLRAVDTDEEFDLWNNGHLLAEAADAIEHCHASHEAMTQEIERLTRERDKARKWQSVAAELSDKLHGTPCAEMRWEYERQDLQSRAEAAERRVEMLREALALAEVVYRKNCIVSGEPSSVLYAMQSTLKETE